jgi:hypothetical protein
MRCKLNDGQIKDLHYSVGSKLIKMGKATLVVDESERLKINPEPAIIRRGRKPKTDE